MIKYLLLLLSVVSLQAQTNTSLYIAFEGSLLTHNTNYIGYKLEEPTIIYWNTEQIATCPLGSTGPQSIADAHTFPSTISLEHANSNALAAAQANLTCTVTNPAIFFNVKITVCCPTESRSAPPIITPTGPNPNGCATVEAGRFSSTVSQAAADNQALIFARSQLSCIPVIPPPDAICDYPVDPHNAANIPTAFTTSYGNVFVFYEYACTPDPVIPLPMGGFANAFVAKADYLMCKSTFSVFLDTEQPHEPFSVLKGKVFFRLYSDHMMADPLIPGSSFHYPDVLLAESAHIPIESIPQLAKSANAPVGWTSFDMSYNLVGGVTYWMVIMSNLDPAVADPTLYNWPAVYWVQDASLIGDDGYRVYLWACKDGLGKDVWQHQPYNKDAGYPAMQTYTYRPSIPPAL